MIVKPSRLKKIGRYIFAILLIIFGIAHYFNVFSYFQRIPLSNYLNLFFVAFGILIILHTELSRLLIKYIISESEISEMKGIIRRKKIKVLPNKVSSIKIKQNIFERGIGIGDIEVYVEEDVPDIVMSGIRNVKEVYSYIESLVGKGVVEYKSKKVLLSTEILKILENKFKESKIIAYKFFEKEKVWKALIYYKQSYFLIELSEEGEIISEIRLNSEEANKVKEKFL